MADQLGQSDPAPADRMADPEEARVPIGFVVDALLDPGGTRRKPSDELSSTLEAIVAVRMESAIGSRDAPLVDPASMPEAALDRAEAAGGNPKSRFRPGLRIPRDEIDDPADRARTGTGRPRASSHLDLLKDIETERRKIAAAGERGVEADPVEKDGDLFWSRAPDGDLESLADAPESPDLDAGHFGEQIVDPGAFDQPLVRPDP